MSAFENIVIGKNSIPSLIITVILMIAIPVISFIYWRKRHKQQPSANNAALAFVCNNHSIFF